jgi:hypothetical protein
VTHSNPGLPVTHPDQALPVTHPNPSLPATYTNRDGRLPRLEAAALVRKAVSQ